MVSPIKLIKGKRPINTNKTGNRKKPPCPSCGEEKRFKLFSIKKPFVHSPFVALSTAIYLGRVRTLTKIKAGMRCQVRIVFHFLVNAVHINIHNPGRPVPPDPWQVLPNQVQWQLYKVVQYYFP